MIKLNLDRADKWIDITDEARIKVRPFDAVVATAGRVYANGRYPKMGSDHHTTIEDTDEDTDDKVGEEYLAALTIGAAKAAILEWSGVTDENDEDIPVTRGAIEAAMRNQGFFIAFQSEYVLPYFLKEAEKNVSTPSPSGSTEEAKITVEDAPNDA